MAKYSEVPNLDDYYNKSYIDELEDELRGLINDNKPIELLYSQNGLRQSRPGEPIVTFDTPMSYIIVEAYHILNGDKRTGEQTLTPGATFNGNLGEPIGTDISISFSSNGLTVTAITSISQLRFNIRGYGRRQ